LTYLEQATVAQFGLIQIQFSPLYPQSTQGSLIVLFSKFSFAQMFSGVQWGQSLLGEIAINPYI
jgi:hypothetical protein